MENMIEKLGKLRVVSKNLRSVEDLIQEQEKLKEEYTSLMDEFKQAYLGKAFSCKNYRFRKEFIYVVEVSEHGIYYLMFDTSLTEPSSNTYLQAYRDYMSFETFMKGDYVEISVIEFMHWLERCIGSVTKDVCGYFGLIKTKYVR